MKIRLLLYITYIFTLSISNAQVFDNSQSHPRLKWKIIKSEYMDLIFPEEFSEQAPKLAHQLDDFLVLMNKNFDRPLRKIPFIVQQNYLTPNGFVMLAPRKSELYSTPSAIADNQAWLPNLALHESRHVIQFDNLTGNLQGVFFQQLAMALFALNLPAWYFEGDATLQETLFSEGGRGRLPSWHMSLRTNLLSEKNYNFNKYIHGSLKDIVPSYYTIGYFMNSELHEIDSLIHPKILQDMRRKLLRPFNFNKALKKYSGMNSQQLFDRTLENLRQKWQEDAAIPVTQKQDKYPTSYLLPQVANGQLYALKESRQRTPAIVRINPTAPMQQQRIVETGRQIMPYFDIRGHLIVWDEYRRDPRFQKQSYNIINIHNLATNNTTRLTSKTRYYTPILSPDLTQIACIEVNEQQESSLILLDATHGEITNRTAIPKGTHIQQPYFHSSGKKIVAIGVREEGTALLEIHVETKEIRTLTEWSNIQYERPIYDEDAVVFKANQEQKDQIYKLENGRIYQLTNSTFGAFNPFVTDSTLWFNDYQVDGYKIQQQPKALWKQTVTLQSAKTLYPAQNSTTYNPTDSLIPKYHIKNYKVTAKSFNFHSISLSGSDFESFDNFRPGIFWLSNDILNTTQAKIGYEYDNDIQKSIYSASLMYQRYLPRLTLTYNNQGQIGQATRNDGSKVNFDWREHYISAEVQLPFTVYRRHYTYSYGIAAGTSLLRRYDISLSSLQNFATSINFPLSYQAYLNRNHNLSAMDLAPRWGQNISLTYRHIPFDTNQTGTAWSLRTNFYFPGIMTNHGLQVRLAVQETSGRYAYHQDIPVPRGFSFYQTEKLRNTMLIDYRFPLAYPDWSIGQLAYIKRIRAELSADYQNLSSSSLSPKTAGGAISIDFNLFKYPLPLFTLSGRITHINDANAKQSFAPSFSFGYSY